MQTQKSAVSAATEHDAKHKPLEQDLPMNVATESSKINHRMQTDTQASADLEARLVAQVIQEASAERLIGTYRGVPDGSDIVIIVWEEGHLDEPVCVLELAAHRVTYLDAAGDCHAEIADRLDALGWTTTRCATMSPIACAIRGSL